MKRILLLCIILINSALLYSQIHIGLRGGVNGSKMYFLPIKTQTYTTGIQGGLVCTYFAQPHLGTQLEINYITKGWKLLDSSDYYKRTVSCIEIPFLSRFEIGNRTVKLVINAGIYSSYALSSDTETKLDGVVTSVKYQFSDSLDNRWEYGVAGGVGLRADFQHFSVLLETRYSQGLRNVFKEINTGKTEKDISLSQIVGVSVGIMIPIWKPKVAQNQ